VSYLLIKHLHVSCVVLSGLGFFLRGWWMLRHAAILNRRLVRVVPHVIDSVLLASAIVLAVMSGQYPFASDWLTAKLVGLTVYVWFGGMALKRGKTKLIRACFFMLAVAVYAYIVSVALTRNPSPWF
jgi:uncharacterized membrane protein SirB2